MPFLNPFRRKNTRRANNRPKRNTTVRNNILRKNTEAHELIENTRSILNVYTNFRPQTCDIRSPNKLPDEPFMSALNRSFVFLYQKMKGLPITNGSNRLTSAQKTELRETVREASKTIPEGDDKFEYLANRLFNTKLDDFDAELKAYEDFSEDKIIKKGTRNAVCAFSVSSYLRRLVPLLLYTDRQQQYLADYSEYMCRSPPTGDIVRSLNSDQCVLVAQSQKVLTNFQRELDVEFKSFIIVKPKYFIPESPSGILFLRADRLLATSFIIDALSNNGIVSIDKVLRKLLRV